MSPTPSLHRERPTMVLRLHDYRVGPETRFNWYSSTIWAAAVWSRSKSSCSGAVDQKSGPVKPRLANPSHMYIHFNLSKKSLGTENSGHLQRSYE